MSSNSAVLVRLYPNAHQAELFRKVCRYRMHYYNGLAMWWNTTYRACKVRYAQFCEKEADETKLKEFSKSLPWPPKKVTKEGLNDTCLKIIFEDVPKRMRFAVARNFTATVKNSRLARHIERVGFYGLRTCIERKVGIDRVSYLNRFAPSSKMCSACGYRNTELTLSDREWTCPECGAHHDRDANAATNIRPSRQRETESCMPQRG